LGTFGVSASNAVPVLCVALKSTDGITTEEAARALGQIRAREDLAVPALIDYLKASGSRHHKFAIEGLSGYSTAVPQTIPLLQSALNDADHDTRAVAQQALARIGLYNKQPIAGQ
jgi:HEAT repeat protein